MRPRSSASSMGLGSLSRRRALATVGRLLPTRLATSSWVRSPCSMRFLYPAASSTGLRSSRCRFSIRAISVFSSSVKRRTRTGTSLKPACWAARKRRSPATMRKEPGSTCSTRMGCSTPFCSMERARSFRPSSEKLLRGWCAPACRADIGTMSTVAPLTKAAEALPSLPESSASIPRPRARLDIAQHLLGQLLVAAGADALRIVLVDGLAGRGGLAEAHVAGDDGAEHLLLEVAAHLFDHLVRQARARVVHRK